MMNIKLFVVAWVLGCVGFNTWAQTEKEVKLDEVTVVASRVVNKADGQLIFPSEAQKKRATNGFSLLAKLPLPNIRVDEVARSITLLGNQGEVQIRINGVRASREELIALEPEQVKSVDFVNNPGVRYGEGIACVIDVKLKRVDAGYLWGVDASNSLTACNGRNAAFFKYNEKKSEFGVSYNQSYRDFRGKRVKTSSNYVFNDSTLFHVDRTDLASHSRTFGNSVEMKYSLMDSDRFVFQMRLSASFDRQPEDWKREQVNFGGSSFMAGSNAHEKSFNPTLDIYLFHALGKRQSLTANLVGTHINTHAFNSFEELEPYLYDVKGKMWSLMGETIYENRLRPFTLSLGTHFSVKRTQNNYSGDVNSLNELRNRGIYLFGELKGRLWSKLAYVAGLGVSNQWYRQQDARYSFWLFRPKATVTYTFSNMWNLAYTFELSQHISKIAMISDTRIKQNSLEWMAGNPDIKPNGVFTHQLRLAFTKSPVTASLNAEYRNHYRPNMEHWSRSADNQFFYTQRNQGSIKMYFVQSNISCDLIPEKLLVSGSADAYHFVNCGDDYLHHYTSFLESASVQAFLGHFTLSGYADSGWCWMEGEKRVCQGAAVYLGGTYRVGNCNIGLFWQHPFQNNPKMSSTKQLDRIVHKEISVYSRNLGNMVTLNFTWKLRRGHSFREVQRRLNNQDTDTGIM